MSVSGSDQCVSISSINDADGQVEEAETAEIVKIDTLMAEREVFAVVMDVEGSELSALKGMRETIERCRPVLGIRVYHRKEDLITIPQYLRTFFDNGKKYHLYIRENSMTRGPYDVTLYAV